jgi:SAM-dependent methyltransferase
MVEGRASDHASLFSELYSAGRVPAGRVLVLKCNDGKDAVFLARRGLAVAACDDKLGELEEARRKALQAGVAIEFSRQDRRGSKWQPLPFADASFASVFSRFEHGPLSLDLVDEIRRVLRPGGVAYLVIPEKSKDAATGKVVSKWNDEKAVLDAAVGFKILDMARYVTESRKETPHSHLDLWLLLQRP